VRDRGEAGERPDRGAPLEELAGRELADVLQQMIATFDRNRGLVGFQNLAEAAQRKGRANGDSQATQSLLAAAARTDNLRRANQGQRQRFRVVGNRVGLSEWLLDGELLRLEREIISLSERYREAMRRTLARKLQEIPHRAVGELVVLLLERLGVTDLTAVRRTGAHGAELHLSGKAAAAGGEMRVAIVVRRDGREIGRERVTELRGALHHYGPAHAGWLITTGQVLSGAREEASANGAAPVSLWDGAALARLCEEHGIGVSFTRVSLPVPDADLFEALRQA
jgi:restriction endonuclease Mrr